MPSKLTATQIAQLNNSNAAMQRAQAGTKLAVLNKITQTVLYSQFTDGGGASGTFTLTDGVIPAGATVLFSAVQDIVGFTGNVSAVITIGDGTDVDRYNTGTPSVFATADEGISVGVPSGTQYQY